VGEDWGSLRVPPRLAEKKKLLERERKDIGGKKERAEKSSPQWMMPEKTIYGDCYGFRKGDLKAGWNFVTKFLGTRRRGPRFQKNYRRVTTN